tara:strand:- start:3911 stop:5710 length:1800 start_codon:yes stop_codon:yes gene_type:complete
MCGFIGCISKDPISSSDFNKVNEYIVCRGPDRNIFFNNHNKKFKNDLNKYFHFEFNRLSILDLSEDADQPMYSEFSDNMLMFNGEIYNHKELRKNLESSGSIFKTNHSDTEVILNGLSKYGLSFIEKLNGQFSIFFLDNNLKKAFLIRDRLGQKPLYYSLSSGKLIFSSNYLSISKVLKNTTLNQEALNNYLNVGVIPGENTILKQVFEVMPGQIVEIDLENLKLTNSFYYWEIEKIAGDSVFNIDEFLSLFRDSVKIRQIADVPIAYFLSGGIDSTSILQSAYETSNEKINTFSVTHENKKYDESVWSNIASNKFKTNHHVQTMKEDIGIELINNSLDSIDQPYFDPSVVPSYILSNMISKHYKVAISGDGGDELLCGYDRVIKSHSINKRTNLAKFLFDIYPSFLGTGNKILRYSKNISESYWSFHEDLKLMKLLNLKPDFSYRDKYTSSSTKSLKDLMVSDYKFYLSQMMLFKVDRTSMANSLEVRSPYLDYRLIEYVLGSNLNFINHEEPKKIMKNYLSNNFDDKFLNRNKQGFVFNVENWVYNNMNYLDSELKDSIVTLEYNKNILKSLSLNKTRINGIRIWKLFVLSQYMKRL